MKSRSLFLIILLGVITLPLLAAANKFLPATSFSTQSSSDASLAAVRRDDRFARNAKGIMTRLPPEEHLRRASVYHVNRAFEEARDHWQALINYYPEDPRVGEAMFGIGRTNYQQRRYEEAYKHYDRLARTYPATKEGREGLNFSAAALLRMGDASAAADRYILYIQHYSDGERIETAHLNAIDTLREAGRLKEAGSWVAQTRQRFAGTATETNALFGLLRLEVAEGDWRRAVSTADELRGKTFQKGVATSKSEVAYLKALSLDRAGNRDEAVAAYLAVPGGIDSYYGWLATDRLEKIGGARRSQVDERIGRNKTLATDAADRYPAPYRQSIISAAKTRKLDPRLVLAIIRQESDFRPTAKSPAGARGLLQLTIDAAHKYAPSAGLKSLQENQLYQPDISIMVGSEYLADLFRLFPNLPEAVAASYNGGEDNVVRWVKRGKHKDPGVFTAEVGFDETKGYVQKVMNNYRVYKQLYNDDLTRR
ncbi:MAG: transglycosylase SLT domain-containing protein [Pyrinomonadaceae bacterium]|nr:transglycosylase SLT domain-containing protein [Pyrinomonadaceae bacterium]